ncbi:MAG TPA: molybdopterin-binding protein [Desulfobulbaceae bacterium]|nr:MAG: molybdopterin-binding protein [Deltaproteobacteria bacterium RIFOXYD12_FULL_53_23]HCC54925.1 molybdopterin-binding protein [Desulfobulbaceae bacterium]
MTKTIPVEQAIGMVLPHDITEIRTGEFKGRAFRKGYIIKAEDIERLKSLGKENIYVLELGEDDIHENEAAELMAKALAGPGTSISGEPVEGKLNIVAAHDGLLKIEVEALYQFNLLGEVMCATLHSNTPVKKGDQLAGTRLIPLVSKRGIVNDAVNIAEKAGGIISVKQLKQARAGLIITGNEVFHGRIKDAFEPVLRKKLAQHGSEVVAVRFAPDNIETIAAEIKTCLDAGANLIITSGGMSVDPDDVTRQGIALAGTENIVYGSPVLPGAMFLVGYIGEIPVLGLPACGMFHKITIFDLILPRVLCGEKISRQDIAQLGHGGLCRQCKTCVYPICGFGK